MSTSPTKPPFLAKRNRLTLDEVRERWRWTTNDLKEAIISGQLVPCIYEQGAIWTMRLDGGGKRSRITPAVFSNRWMYVVGVNPTGPFACNFEYLADAHDALTDGKDVYQRDTKGNGFIDNRVTLAEVMADGVFDMAELDRYEATHGREGNASGDGAVGGRRPWWQERYDIVSIASRIQERWKVDDRGVNQSGARAGKYSLSALSEAVAAEIERAEKAKKSALTISGKSVGNYLKGKGWD